MSKRQQGVTLVTLIIILFLLVIVGIFGMRLIPAYIQYFKIKAAVVAIAGDKSKTGSVADIRKAFEARSEIDDIDAIKPDDLDITKEGGQVVISFEYQQTLPLAGNVSLLVDFKGSSAPGE